MPKNELKEPVVISAAAQRFGEWIFGRMEKNKGEWKHVEIPRKEAKARVYALLRYEDIKNWEPFLIKLREPERLRLENPANPRDPAIRFWHFLADRLHEHHQKPLKQLRSRSGLGTKPQRQVLIECLNDIMQRESLYDEKRFTEIALRRITRVYINTRHQIQDHVYLNRLLLEDVFPLEIKRNSVTYKRFHEDFERIFTHIDPETEEEYFIAPRVDYQAIDEMRRFLNSEAMLKNEVQRREENNRKKPKNSHTPTKGAVSLNELEGLPVHPDHKVISEKEAIALFGKLSGGKRTKAWFYRKLIEMFRLDPNLDDESVRNSVVFNYYWISELADFCGEKRSWESRIAAKKRHHKRNSKRSQKK